MQGRVASPLEYKLSRLRSGFKQIQIHSECYNGSAGWSGIVIFDGRSMKPQKGQEQSSSPDKFNPKSREVSYHATVMHASYATTPLTLCSLPLAWPPAQASSSGIPCPARPGPGLRWIVSCNDCNDIVIGSSVHAVNEIASAASDTEISALGSERSSIHCRASQLGPLHQHEI